MAIPKPPKALPELLTIGQLATRGGIAASALRFYESQGLLHTIRVDHNQRRYHRDALRRVAFIRAAQTVGLSLEDIKKAMDRLPESSTATHADWRAVSIAWKAQLDERQRLIERMRDDIESCIGCGCLSMEQCIRYNPNDSAALLGHGAQYLKGRTPADAGVEV
ncbi:MAG TPA: redox-sensitive transcriptional activator SoxR [Ilumatobacteraceae bacterium]|nr:redox-sensitive transcriptional activator SoxR [Ilumatobacteraceae bacterium]HRB01779.1 redox-sensitive transcriptional activator SoxR [Ilumatobacteraceae bacterium]